MTLQAQKEKAERLRQLHHGTEILVFANAWDAISARVFESMGFPAIATTSAGIAAALGYPDGQEITLAEMAEAVRRIASTVSVPVTADMEAGYGDNEESAVLTAVETIKAGAVGFNIEDGTRNPAQPLFESGLQARRISAARRAADDHKVPLVINARTDAYWAEVGDEGTRLAEAVNRGNAYLDAGADCIFVPGATKPEVIEALCREIKGPINILGVPGAPSIPELKRLGVARVSVGSGLSRAALGYARLCAEELLASGTYTRIAETALPHTEVKRLLKSK